MTKFIPILRKLVYEVDLCPKIYLELDEDEELEDELELDIKSLQIFYYRQTLLLSKNCLRTRTGQSINHFKELILDDK